MNEALRSDGSSELTGRLRSLRIDHGLTEEKVAEHLGWSLSKISRIETGHRDEPTNDARNHEVVSILDDAGFTPDYGLCRSYHSGSRTGGAPERDELRARAAAQATPDLEFTLILSVIIDEAALRCLMGCGAVENSTEAAH